MNYENNHHKCLVDWRGCSCCSAFHDLQQHSSVSVPTPFQATLKGCEDASLIGFLYFLSTSLSICHNMFQLTSSQKLTKMMTAFFLCLQKLLLCLRIIQKFRLIILAAQGRFFCKTTCLYKSMQMIRSYFKIF